MRSLIFLFCVLVASSAGANGADANAMSPAEDSCARAHARRVQDFYDGIRDFAADFEQRSEVVSLGGKSLDGGLSQGQVVMAKPGKMRWHYKNPDGSDVSLVLTDGESLWLYDPEAREVQYFAVGSEFLSGAAIQFLFGEGDLIQSFEIKAEDCNASPVVLELTPREPASYEKLKLEVDTKTGKILESSVFDIVGNVTHVRFRNSLVNLDPDPGVFQFKAPKGVRVIQSGPGF